MNEKFQARISRLGPSTEFWSCGHKHWSRESAWPCAIRQTRRDLKLSRQGQTPAGVAEMDSYHVRVEQL